MKPETQKLLDRYQKLNRQDFNSETRIDFMRVCDVEELIKKLMKWNKREDVLPENQNIVLVKSDKGCYCTAYLHGKASGFITYGDDAYENFGKVIEWKYIY